MTGENLSWNSYLRHMTRTDLVTTVPMMSANKTTTALLQMVYVFNNSSLRGDMA
jgi:hypothetical protein